VDHQPAALRAASLVLQAARSALPRPLRSRCRTRTWGSWRDSDRDLERRVGARLELAGIGT
jgi:hypothetical protein